MTASIVTDKLTKFYGREKTPALDNLSIQIQPGEVYGYLGANGAGKTTTIRLLLNFLQPSGGSARIMGLDTVKDSVSAKKHIGYLSGDVALYQKPTGRQILDLLSSFQPATDYRSVLEKRFEADLDKPVGALSKGNRQKIGIIQAFMHEPAVLILDEPTSGLDPLMQEAFYQTLLESKQRGAAILMSSHNLAEAQRVCDRVGIIRRGRLVQEQPITQDISLAAMTFRVTFAKPAEFKAAKATRGIRFISQVDGKTALFKPSGSITEALSALSHFEIHELSTLQTDLEDEFLEFYGDGS